MKLLPALAFAGMVVASTAAHAQEPTPPASPGVQVDAAATNTQPSPVNIIVDVQMVVIPIGTAAPLVRELMDPNKTSAAYEKIQGLITSGEAKLVGWPMIITQSGQRAVFEAIDEFRFAADYTAGGIGVYFPDRETMEHTKADANSKEMKNTVSGTDFAGIPSSFETRNTGVSLEVEPTISEDLKKITLNIVPQHVRIKGMNQVAIERPETKEKVIVEQPEFTTMKSVTTFTIKNGEQRLLGVYPTTDPPNHLELFILRGEWRKVD